MRRTLLWGVVAAATLACRPASAPRSVAPRAPMAAEKGAACALSGRLARASDVYVDATGEEAIAYAFGPVGVSVSLLVPGPSRRAQVTIRAPAKGPGLRVDGWIRAGDLPLTSTRQLPVVEGHVWISSGAPLTVLEGEGERVRVESVYTEGFEGLSTETECSALTLEHDGPIAHGTVPKGARPHTVHNHALRLYDEADGTLVVTLRPRAMDLLTLYVTESSGGFRRIVYEDWVRITGWVRAEDLEEGEGGDCDDCRGGVTDVPDRCPDDESVPGCEGPIRTAAVDEEVREQPSSLARTIAHLDAHAAVRVLERRDGWARIEPLAGGLEAAARGPVRLGFWVPEDALAD